MLYQLLFGTSRVMACTVHEGPHPTTDRMDRADALRFVKDGFSWPAALTGPLWLALHRLWYAVGAYVAVATIIVGASYMFGMRDIFAAIALVAVHLSIGFEADTIERSELERQGWTTLGSVTGASALECQRRFFDHWLPAQPILASKTAQPPQQLVAEPRPQVTSGRGAQSAAGRLAQLWRGSK